MLIDWWSRKQFICTRLYASTTDSARIAKTSPHDQSDLWRGFFNISYTWEVCGIQAIEKKLPKSRFQEKPGYVTERRVVAWKEALKHSKLKIHRVARPSVDRFCFDSAGSDVFFPGCERKRQYERARTQEVVYGKLVTRIDSQYLYHSSVLSRAHVHKWATVMSRAHACSLNLDMYKSGVDAPLDSWVFLQS